MRVKQKSTLAVVAALVVLVLQGWQPGLLDDWMAASAEAETPFDQPLPERWMSFAQAKRFLQQEVHAPGEEDYYCGCEMYAEGRAWRVDWASCGYEVRRNAERAARIEWEHVVPASEFGQQRPCWRDGGRRNCTANDPVFNAMEGDPHNLIPVVGEVNGDRGNLRFGMIRAQDGSGYGQCGSRVDFQARTFMPRAEVRGDVARIYFYFRDRYGLAISRQKEQLYTAWHRQDPVDGRECLRHQRIADKTGIENPYIAAECDNQRVAISDNQYRQLN